MEDFRMPLRDHFRSPVNDRHRWDAVHGWWPAEIARHLFDLLPPGFQAEPKVHHGAPFEVDVSMVEDDARPPGVTADEVGGTATLAAADTALTLDADLTEFDEYEVRVYDVERERRLVAAIAIVSPANKDRPDRREQFVNKVAALLQREVSVTVVDVVTVPQFNLYAELLARIGQTDPRLGDPPAPLSAVTLRTRKPPKKRRGVLDTWYFPMAVGQPLPVIPLWLSPDLHIELPLEPSYQEVCRLLRIA